MALGTNGMTFPIARKHVAVLRALRAPARFAILVQLTLGVLAAMGLARAAARWPRIGPTLVVASACLVMVEYANGPLHGAAAARAAAADLRLARHPAETGHPRAADAAAARAAAARPVLHVRVDVALAAARQRLQRALLGTLRRADRGAAGSARAQVDRRPHRDGRAAHPGAREAVPGGQLSAAHRRHRGAPDVPPRNGVGGSPRRGSRLRVPPGLRTASASGRRGAAARVRRGRTWWPASRPTGSRPSSIRRCCRRTGPRRSGGSR